MARPKLMPKTPGTTTLAPGSLAKPKTGRPMNGAGERATGRPKLDPMSGMKPMGMGGRVKGGAMDGVRGPTKGS